MKLKVIGIGDNVVDKYLHLGLMYPGGNALNFSVYAQKTGAQSAYLGVFGDDVAARHLQETLRHLKIDAIKENKKSAKRQHKAKPNRKEKQRPNQKN